MIRTTLLISEVNNGTSGVTGIINHISNTAVSYVSQPLALKNCRQLLSSVSCRNI